MGKLTPAEVAALEKEHAAASSDGLSVPAPVNPLPDPSSFFESAYKAPQAFVRGVYRSPADVLAMSEFMRGGAHKPGYTPGMSIAEYKSLPTQSQIMDQLQIARSGIPEPQGYPERVAERLGRTSPFVAASLPGIGFSAPSPLLALRNEVIADTVSAMGEQGTQDVGAGPGVQFTAGILGGMVAPGSIGDDAARTAAELRKSGTVKAISEMYGIRPQKAGRRSWLGIQPYRNPFSNEVSDAATARANEIAKELNVDPKSMRRASSEAKRRMSRDPYGNESLIVEGSNRIDEARGLFPDKNNRPLTDQILNNEPDVAAMGAELDKMDHEFRASAAGRRRIVQADLERQFEDMLPNGTSEGVNRSGQAVWDQVKADEDTLWSAIPKERMPLIDLSETRNELNAIRRDPKNSSGKYLPGEFNAIDAMPIDAPFSQVQATFSDLGKIMGEAKRSLPGSPIRQVANRVAPVYAAMKRALDAVPESAGGAEFQAARNFTSSRAELFNPESAGYRAVMDPMDGPQRARTLLNADQGRQEAQRAVDIVGRTPNGREQLSRVLIDELFDESLGQKTPRQILIQLRRKRDVYRTVWGDDRYKLFETLVNKADMSRRRKTGTTAAVDSTGTGRAPLDILFGGAEAVTEPITTAKKVVQAIRKSVSTDKERSAILREAMYDPDLWQTLLQMPEPRAVASWITNWDRLVARASARANLSARVAARAQGASRDEQLRIEQAFPSDAGGVR